ncbi:pre-piRNA 3'-exonuclease trimmer-like isoform X2 [Plodia interpunctella]|uniref:pre-piRNA 3'-exonuclease trimmer-like isoform X2 n=1 Tax=Plodia interpunctella TaxID=58824 RepID=UPI003100D579
MEITRNNFLDQLDNITRNIKRSCFIGFDAEFSALLSGEKYKYRLFDTNEDRYNLLKNKASEMIMTQVGLTIYQYERDLDTYVANGYTFHLCPQVFGNIDQSFIFQASTLKFLCKHKFNFNKFLYEGIPYLSKVEENRIQQQIKDKTLFANLIQDLEMTDEKIIQNYCSDVSKWLIKSEEDTMYLDVENPVLRYIIHNEIRLRFPEVLTTDSLGNSNKVLVYRNKDIQGANSAPMAILEDNLLRHILGFSQIISLLKTERKPLIGHNMFLDTVLLHNQFIGPLPQKYSTFKKNIHDVLPIIFDTKYISHVMKNNLSFDEMWKSNSLQDLYEFFSEGKCKKLEHGVNLIRLSTPFDVKQSYHEAGWDSYCSGYCFIRLGHWAACENSGAYRPLGPRQQLAALAPHCNKINVIRGAIAYMNLAGPDPPSHRPDFLYVKSLKERVINVGKVASVLTGIGSVDVKPYGRRTALVATASNYTVEKILKHFNDSREYQITKFTVYRHSPLSQVVFWGGALITGGLVLLLVHKKVK